METLVLLLIFTVGVLLIVPIAICVSLGESRGRTGWAWGLLLGWLGVLILACMRPIPLDERQGQQWRDNPAGIWPPPGR